MQEAEPCNTGIHALPQHSQNPALTPGEGEAHGAATGATMGGGERWPHGHHYLLQKY